MCSNMALYEKYLRSHQTYDGQETEQKFLQKVSTLKVNWASTTVAKSFKFFHFSYKTAAFATQTLQKKLIFKKFSAFFS